jgi:hypothetical protein
MRLVPALSFCLIAIACVSSPAAAAEPKLDMLAFFAGKTHAENAIKIALHGPHKLIVDSIGGHNKEGEFVLIDTVQEEGKPVRKRTWVMRPAGPNRFTGVLSDAKGAVDVTVSGDSALIRYTMKEGGLKVEQRVQLQRDGTLSNTVIAKKFGLKVASVDGTIRKVD